MTRRQAVLLACASIVLAICLVPRTYSRRRRTPSALASPRAAARRRRADHGWIFQQQKSFERMLSGAVRAIKTDTSALWGLLGISFAYGVFHAAGPGHGKAVVAPT